MISYSRKVGLRKPGTFEWAQSQIPPDSDGLAEWIAYQESVLNQDQVESLRQWWHGYETRSIVEIEPSPDIDQDDLLEPRPGFGVTYRTVKGALLGPGSGIETVEQANRVVRALRGLPRELIAEGVAVQGFPLNVQTGLPVDGDRDHCGNRTLTGDHHAVCDCPPSANLVDTVRKTADRYDPRGQESDDGQVHGPDGWWGGS